MKVYSKIYSVILSAILIQVFLSCEKENVVLPSIKTTPVKIVSSTSVASGGEITTEGSSPITKSGICWDTSSNPTTANFKTEDDYGGYGKFLFDKVIEGLINNTNYFLRAYATTRNGTVYGEEQHFNLYMNVPDADVTDFDGNVYHSVKIGGQVWMVRNLNVTHFRNGDPILNVTGNAWEFLSTGAYCNYNNDIYNSAVYGRLYNWWAVNDSRKISPSGWHVASRDEWSTLAIYLGGIWIAADKLMEKGNAHWQNTSGTITNEAGFYALPGGVAFGDRFFNLGLEANWWSTTRENPYSAVYYNIQKIGGLLSQNRGFESNGFSIRCVKD